MAKRPFWLSAVNYYAATIFLALVLLLVVYGVLHDVNDDSPWIPAIFSSIILVTSAVILREVFLRRARDRMLLVEKNFDRQLNNVYSRFRNVRDSGKLSIERNDTLVAEIKAKSEAAKVLGRFSAGHREVFELCEDYLARIERELKEMGTGSPRFGSLRKGKERVSRYHRFHVLQWAEIEVRALTLEAKSRSHLSEKIEAAQKAIHVIEEALGHYPSDESLVESRKVLEELLVSIKVSNLVEQAELAAFRGEYSKARGAYRDALFFLGRDHVRSENRVLAVQRIQHEIERIREFEDGMQ